jgi:hypothetical protein
MCSKSLMMEAARTSETLVNFYQTTLRRNPEEGHLQNKFCLIKSAAEVVFILSSISYEQCDPV